MTPPLPPPPGAPTTEPDAARVEGIRLKERIYAVITMVAVVVALSDDTAITAPDAAWSISGTALGVWLATLVADQQSFRVVHHALARGEHLRVMLHTSAPMLLSAVVPLLCTAGAALGLLALPTALLTAVAVELAGLFAWGVLGGLRLGGGPIPAVVAGLADLAVGVIIVSVKVAAGH